MVGEADTLSTENLGAMRPGLGPTDSHISCSIPCTARSSRKANSGGGETAFADFMARAPFPLVRGGELAILSPPSAAALAFDRRR